MEQSDEEFYNKIEELAKKKKLPPTQRICPNCGDLLDCKDRNVLVMCSCGCLGIDSCGLDEVVRTAYISPDKIK